jgi:hypothetical protein
MSVAVRRWTNVLPAKLMVREMRALDVCVKRWHLFGFVDIRMCFHRAWKSYDFGLKSLIWLIN